MLRFIQAVTFTLLVAFIALGETPKVGDPAPEFNLPSQTGKPVALKDYAGKAKVVLVFYRGNW